MAATLGIGAVGCGAIGDAVSYGMDCSKAHNCSAAGAAEAVDLGALGAGLAGPLGGKLVSDALNGVLPEVATQGLVGAGSGAVSGGLTALAGYGMNGGRNCSVSGALSAAATGAAAGGVGGAAFGALGGLRARGRSSVEEEAPSCPIPHSFLAGTKVLLADGSSKPISSVHVGDRVANSDPGKAGLETHPVDRVIVTATDHDFVDVKVKPSRVRRAVGRAVAGLAVAAAVVTGGAATASAAPATLTTTYHHPFYDVMRGAFVEAVDLQVGDRLQTADGGEATVEEVAPYHSTEVTYDLTIDELHTYYVYAGDVPVLVHNCGGELPGHRTVCECANGAKPAMIRGPKPAGTGPHNLKIAEVAEQVTDGDVIAGGGMLPEQGFPTPGGFKGSRRPDILVEREDGTQYGINVGKQSMRTGAPIRREAEAISDLEGIGMEMHFVPCN